MLIRQKFDNVGYPSPFTNSVTRDYDHNQNKRQEQEDEYFMPPNIFEIAKESILVEFPYCPHKDVTKRFLSKFHQFTNQKFQVTIKRITKKVKSLFSWKDKTLTQRAKFIKERVFLTRHILVKPFGMLTFDGMSINIPMSHKESEPGMHLRENLNQKLKWKTLLQAPKN